MEQNFQTSFIPKKPMVPERAQSSRPIGLLFVLSILILFAVIVATGSLYFYKSALQKNLIDPVFSNLTLDNSGNVLFDLEFSVEPSFINYKQTLLADSADSVENTTVPN